MKQTGVEPRNDNEIKPGETEKNLETEAEIGTYAYPRNSKLCNLAVLETLGQIMVSDNIPELAGRNPSWFYDAADVISKTEHDLDSQVAAINRLLEKWLADDTKQTADAGAFHA